jgi:deoxycytidylate deaminase
MNEYKILNRLKNEMIKRRHEKYNVGAVIVDKKGRVLSYGFNSYVKTHPSMLQNKYYRKDQVYVHAECDAIYRLLDTQIPYAMFVCRINKKNNFVLSKPCSGCYYEILNTEIKQVFYTNDNEELLLLDLTVSIEEFLNGC